MSQYKLVEVLKFDTATQSACNPHFPVGFGSTPNSVGHSVLLLKRQVISNLASSLRGLVAITCMSHSGGDTKGPKGHGASTSAFGAFEDCMNSTVESNP